MTSFKDSFSQYARRRRWPQSAEERFLAKVTRTPTCWLWTGATNKRGGYGMIHSGSGSRLATHMALRVFKNVQIPAGAIVCHSCDVPLCVNPEHVWIGTQKDNIGDMDRKGRGVRVKGEKHPKAKLTERDVIQARFIHQVQGVSYAEIGRRLGVHPDTISYAVRGKTWKHI